MASRFKVTNMAKYWLSAPPPKCNLCKTPITTEFFDCQTDINGIWGYLCIQCFQNHGIGLGEGKGQHYKLQDNGQWLLFAGSIEE